MHEPLDSFLELHKRAVGKNIDGPAGDLRTDGVFGLDAGPGTFGLLLEAERNALLLFVDLENLDLDFLVDRHDFRRMVDAPPTHIRDMEETINTAQIDKSAKVGDVLDDTLANLVDLDLFEKLALLLFSLILEKLASRDDNVHPRARRPAHQYREANHP